jgi:hypothetical protein
MNSCYLSDEINRESEACRNQTASGGRTVDGGGGCLAKMVPTAQALIRSMRNSSLVPLLFSARSPME